MTDDKLAAIEARYWSAMKAGADSSVERDNWRALLQLSSADVPALVAEVKRLRAALAAERERCAAHCDRVENVYGTGNPEEMFSDEVAAVVSELAEVIRAGTPAPSPPDAPRT